MWSFRTLIFRLYQITSWDVIERRGQCLMLLKLRTSGTPGFKFLLYSHFQHHICFHSRRLDDAQTCHPVEDLNLGLTRWLWLEKLQLLWAFSKYITRVKNVLFLSAFKKKKWTHKTSVDAGKFKILTEFKSNSQKDDLSTISSLSFLTTS